MKTTHSIIILSYLLFACSSNSEHSERINSAALESFEITSNSILTKNSAEAIEIPLDEIESTIAVASEIFKKREYIELKTPEDILIGKVSEIKLFGDNLLILDRDITKNVYLFDLNGNFKFEVGVRGNGPNEYDEPISIDINTNYIYIVDRAFNVHIFDLENQFVSKVQIPFFSHSIAVDNANKMFFSNNTTDYSPLNYQIIGLDEEKIFFKSLENYGSAISMYTSQPISSNKKLDENSFLFSPPWGNAIYEKVENEVKERYKLNSELAVPSQLLDNNSKLMNSQWEYSYFYNSPILETERDIMFRIYSKNKIKTIIHNKINNTFRAYEGITDDILLGALSDFPISSHGLNYYIPLNVEQLYSSKRRMQNMTNSAVEKFRLSKTEASQLMESIGELSNPIILKCEF